METILELASILGRKRLSSIDILDKTFLRKSKNDLLYRFYEGLDTGEITDDNSACIKLYSTKIPDNRYRMLKSRLKKKLFNTILLIDPDDYFHNNQKNKAYFECSTTLRNIEILIKIRGINKVIAELIKENYIKAEHYRFYDILKMYSYYLLSYYSLSGDLSRFKKEIIKFDKFNIFSNHEINAKLINTKITIQFTNCKKINSDFIKSITNHINELEKIIETFPDPESTYFYYHSLSIIKEATGAYEEFLDVINKIDKLFFDFPFIATIGRRAINNTSKAKVYLYLQKNEDGLNTITNPLCGLLDNGSHNWYLTKDIEFKINLQCKNIYNCKIIYNEVKNNKFHKRQFPYTIEKWKIYEAYLVFMDSYVNKGDYKFAIGKFLNEVPFYTKDKSGFNFSIKVIEILFHFARKQYNIIFAKTDALKIYRTRYLNDDTYIRSRLFLNALLKAEKHGFNPDRMRMGYPEIEQLKSRENQLIIADWEVYPYEMLWDILIDLAQNH